MDYPNVCIEVVVMNYGSALLIREGGFDSDGQWSFPRTVQDKGETIQQAAVRAVHDACGITIEAANAVNAYDQIHGDGNSTEIQHQVVLDIEGRYIDGEFTCDNETSMAAWASGIALKTMDVDKTTLAILKSLGFVDWL
ncbi:NUDIX domain-containing protein [Pseudomonadota bacterium]